MLKIHLPSLLGYTICVDGGPVDFLVTESVYFTKNLGSTLRFVERAVASLTRYSIGIYLDIDTERARAKIKVVYNPPPEVPLMEKKLSSPPSMLYMGGDMCTKGIHIFLKASMKLLHKEGNVKFMVTGRVGDQWKKLFSILNRRIGITYKVLGYVPRESLFKLHSESYALLFPSIWEEPLPYAVLESMLAGTIPVASRAGGVPEIAQGTYAESMLFTPGSVDELVDRMETILSLSHEELTDIGASLRERTLKKFNVSIAKNQLLNIFSVV